jgi:hypothetical protein
MKNNIAYMLLSALILVALPAGCASKKNKSAKAKTEHEVTLNNNVDSISIQEINEASVAQEDASVVEDANTVNISKF